MSDEGGERPPDRIHGERFAIVPEWLLSESGDLVKLYAILDRYANKTGRLWPGQVELAEKMGCSDRHVRSLLARMRQIGALEVAKRRYNGSTIHRLNKDRPEPGFLSDWNEGATLSGTSVPPNESQRTRAKKHSARADPNFDLFYATYPRKYAPGDALKAWTAAVKKASPEVIIAGAARYRDDPNREAAYTKTPGPWLRAECWADDPLPCRPDARRNGHSEPTDLREIPTTPIDPDDAYDYAREDEEWGKARDPGQANR